MKIHEYQGKEILRQFGVPVPRGIPAFTVQEAVEAAQKLGGPVWVVKAQIHAGGRGKGGGVKVAKSIEDVLRPGGPEIKVGGAAAGSRTALILPSRSSRAQGGQGETGGRGGDDRRHRQAHRAGPRRHPLARPGLPGSRLQRGEGQGQGCPTT